MSTFSIDVQRWVDKAKRRLDLVVRKVSLELFTRVILRTPVDTGRARANWICAIGDMPEGTIELDDKQGTATISRAAAEVAKAKAGDTIWLVNSLPYAARLETGWSKQAPAGMVGITVAEFNAIVARSTDDTNRDK